MTELEKELKIRFIKLIDIGYIGGIHFIAGFCIAVAIDKILGKVNEKEEAKKSTLRLVIEVTGLACLNGILYYIAKNMLELIPFPLDNVWGFHHMKVKEVKSAPLLALSLLLYQSNLQKRVQALYARVATNPV